MPLHTNEHAFSIGYRLSRRLFADEQRALKLELHKMLTEKQPYIQQRIISGMLDGLQRDEQIKQEQSRGN